MNCRLHSIYNFPYRLLVLSQTCTDRANLNIMGNGASFARGILILFNVLIWLCGMVVLALGAWLLADPNAGHLLSVATAANTSLVLLHGAAISLVVVGAFAFIVGFFGCCGAIKENICMLNTYAAVLVLLLVLQVAAGIAGLVFRNTIDEELGKSMNATVQTKFQYNGTDDITVSYAYMQREFKCCGAQGPLDWKTSSWKKEAPSSENVPLTCCVTSAQEAVVNVNECQRLAYTNTTDRARYVHVEGCEEQLHEWVEGHAAIIAGVALGLAVVQLISVILACTLKRSVNSEYQYV